MHIVVYNERQIFLLAEHGEVVFMTTAQKLEQEGVVVKLNPPVAPPVNNENKW